ncbi:MAG: hypothetical protein MI751_04855, partial [Pseudomonadales bacterium]|nr:hypothetical protein [Pseudomonadales bacterium]
MHGDPSLGEERFCLCFFVRGEAVGIFLTLYIWRVSGCVSGIPPSFRLGSPCEQVIRFAPPVGAALRSYDVLRLFIGAELNDLDGVSVLLKKPELFWV